MASTALKQRRNTISQARREPKCPRRCVSLSDDSQPAHSLQSSGQSQARRAPPKNYSARHAQREDAAGSGGETILKIELHFKYRGFALSQATDFWPTLGKTKRLPSSGAALSD